jgi:hypothetical protein
MKTVQTLQKRKDTYVYKEVTIQLIITVDFLHKLCLHIKKTLEGRIIFTDILIIKLVPKFDKNLNFWINRFV